LISLQRPVSSLQHPDCTFHTDSFILHCINKVFCSQLFFHSVSLYPNIHFLTHNPLNSFHTVWARVQQTLQPLIYLLQTILTAYAAAGDYRIAVHGKSVVVPSWKPCTLRSPLFSHHFNKNH
jgi:hypothetical protein